MKKPKKMKMAGSGLDTPAPMGMDGTMGGQGQAFKHGGKVAGFKSKETAHNGHKHGKKAKMSHGGRVHTCMGV